MIHYPKIIDYNYINNIITYCYYILISYYSLMDVCNYNDITQ